MKLLKTCSMLLMVFACSKLQAQDATTLATKNLNTKNEGITKQEKGYFNITELGYHMGAMAYPINPSGDKRYDFTEAISLRTVNGLFLNSQVSVGIGIGIEGYKGPYSRFFDETAFQVYADGRYYFKDAKNTPFVYGNVGHTIAFTDNFMNGLYAAGGVGYKFKVGNRSALQTSLGYSHQAEEKFRKSNYMTGTLRVGFLF